MGRYSLSNLAVADLESILSTGLLNHGTLRAHEYFDAIIRQFENLTVHPLLYAERIEIHPPVRVCPIGVHVIIYSVLDDKDVHIIRIRHGREDWL